MIDETVANESVEAGVPEAEAGADDALQLIAFSLGKQHFCVNIMSVREIRAWTGTTELPNTAPFVRGVINLRGAIVPIMDLRTR
ncbi:MAG: chemotaxis protein CheW, partial [Planctomycetota bacterium]